MIMTMKDNTLLIILLASAALYYMHTQRQQNTPNQLDAGDTSNNLINAQVGSRSRILRRVNKTV